MSQNVAQTSFAAGELAPSIYARTDIAAYHQGLTICRNFFVDYRSGISTRQGQSFVLQCKQPNSRLIPFSVSVNTTYMVEFGNFYARFINNGAAVLETPFAISHITQADPAVLSVPGNNFAVGDWLFISDVMGMLAINSRYVVVTAISGASVTVSDVNGNPIDSTIFAAYSSGGEAARVYTIASPFAASDLPLLKYVESVSVLYLTHPSYPVQTLSFFGPNNWVFAPVVFGTLQQPPTSPTTVVTIVTGPSPAVNTTYEYAVTAVDSLGEESLPAIAAQVTVNGDIGETSGTATTSWTAPSGAQGGYNVYRAQVSFTGSIPTGAAFGFLGIANAGATSFIDSNIQPDFSTSPPIVNNNPFNAPGNYPGCCTFFQQRLYLASTNNAQATFWASQPGIYNNFNYSDPIQESDLIQGTIVSTQLNTIRAMLPMPGGLIILTGKAAFTLSAGQGANSTIAVTPANATLLPQAYNGISDVPPLVVNEDILYVQAKGAIVRDLSYNIYAAIYTGTDISIRSNHLFFGYTIIQWTYAEEPFKIIWAVRSDGVLLSLTFMKEQQIMGWARHDTQGLYLSVASIQEGQVDATYFIVERLLPNGSTVQWIERQMERTLAYGVEDSWSVDAGTSTAPSLPTPAATAIFSAATDTATVMTSANIFSAASVGNVIRAGNGIAVVTAFIAPNQVQVSITQTILATIPNTNVPLIFTAGNWSLSIPATTFFGFDYLIGQIINVLADGGVYNGLIVAADGSITLPNPATKVVGGLGFQCQAQTMPLDVGEPTIQGKRKKVGALNLKLASSRGIKAGRTFNTLIQLKDLPVYIPLGQSNPLISGDWRMVMDPLWDVPGQICLQVDDPVPASILGVIPEVTIGDTGK